MNSQESSRRRFLREGVMLAGLAAGAARSNSEAKMADYKIFDLHQHFGPLQPGYGTHGKSMGWDIEGDYKQRVALMDRFGVSKGGLMPSLQYERPEGQEDTKRINNLIAEYKKRHGDRFPVAFGVVEVLHGEKAGLQELDRIKGELNLNGVVWHHHFQGSFIADRRMWPFLKKMDELGLVAAIHLVPASLLEAPWGLELLLADFPNLTFLAIDGLMESTQSHYVLSMHKRYRNFYVDTTAAVSLGKIVDAFVGQVGSERLTYGSDLYLNPSPLYNAPSVLTDILESQALSDQDRRNIFWNNVSRIFKLESDH